jgi:hypothetical protein
MLRSTRLRPLYTHRKEYSTETRKELLRTRWFKLSDSSAAERRESWSVVMQHPVLAADHLARRVSCLVTLTAVSPATCFDRMRPSSGRLNVPELGPYLVTIEIVADSAKISLEM